MRDVALAFIFGAIIGFFVKWVLVRRENIYGIINTLHQDGKTVYSLEFDQAIDRIEERKKVIFKVNNSDRDENLVYSED